MPRRQTASADEQLLVLGRGQQASGDDDVADRRSLGLGGAHDVAGRLVADLGHQGRGRGARSAHVRCAAFLVGLQALDAEAAQDLVGVRQQREALQQAVGDEREEGVQLEAAEAGGDGDGGVMAGDQQGHLAHGLGDHGVDLAGHDAGAGLPLRQPDLAEPGLRPRAHEAQVAADLEQRHGVRLEDARHLDEHVGVLRGLGEVLGAREADAGELAQRVDDAEDVLPRRREAGADGRAAQVDDAQALLALVDAPAVAVEGLGIGAHLAAQRGEHRVLVLGAADLDHVGERLLLLLEGLLQGHHLLLEPVQERDGRQAQGGGVGVVGALVQVEVVERRDARVAAGRLAEDLQGAVGQHLVDVHVGAGAGAALQAVDDDLRGEPAVGQLAAGALDGVGLGLVAGPRAERAVGARAGELHRAEGTGQLAVHRLAGEREVLEGALGMRAVQARGRHGHLAQQVALDAHVVAHEFSTRLGLRASVTEEHLLDDDALDLVELGHHRRGLVVTSEELDEHDAARRAHVRVHVVQADARLDVAPVLGEDLLHVRRVLEAVADVDAEDDVVVVHVGSSRRGSPFGPRRSRQQSTSRPPALTWSSILWVCARRTSSISASLCAMSSSPTARVSSLP